MRAARPALIVLAAALLAAAAARAEDRLSAVHAFPEFLVYTKSFLGFVEDVNARGAGIVQIDVRGGPEAIGSREQFAAVRDGVVDMAALPASYYGASVPEADAMAASAITPMEARANGGFALLDDAHRRQVNATLLAWPDGGVGFHVYTAERPDLLDDGMVDLSPFTIRDTPIYHEFFKALGAVTTSLKVPEVYTALERGAVDAAPFTSIGIRDQKWDRFLRYRIDPAFYSTDLALIVNLFSWIALSAESQALLTEAAIAWEERSFADRAADRDAELAMLLDEGMEIVAMEGDAAARWRRMSIDAAWERMTRRLEQRGKSAETAMRLKTLLAPE